MGEVRKIFFPFFQKNHYPDHCPNLTNDESSKIWYNDYYRASINKVSLVSGELNNMEGLSHELFHAYQDDNGRIPGTVYNEVEAYIFSGMMSGKRTMGMMSDKNSEYSNHANRMMKGFSSESTSVY